MLVGARGGIGRVALRSPCWSAGRRSRAPGPGGTPPPGAVFDHAGGFAAGARRSGHRQDDAARRDGRAPACWSSGADPENVLVLTASRRASVEMRAHITRLLTGQTMCATVREPLVRTVHSYAFAVLRTQAVLRGEPAAAAAVRAGAGRDGARAAGRRRRGRARRTGRSGCGPRWTLPGFAHELRDLMLRAAERGLGPEDLIELGRQARARRVGRGRACSRMQYEQVTLLPGSGSATASAPSLDAAELVGSALLGVRRPTRTCWRPNGGGCGTCWSTTRSTSTRMQYRADPHAGRRRPSEFVLAGDPDQAIFSFRGADPATAGGTADGEHRRAAAGPPDGARGPGRGRPAGRAAAGARRRRRAVVPADGAGPVQVRLLAVGGAGGELGRRPAAPGAPDRRGAVVGDGRDGALGDPVVAGAATGAAGRGRAGGRAADELPLAQQPAVRPLLALLRCAAVPGSLDEDAAAMLLSSALGGADPLALRRLRRGLRRLEMAAGGDRPSGELLVEVIECSDRLAALEDAESLPVRADRRHCCAIAREAIEDGHVGRAGAVGAVAGERAAGPLGRAVRRGAAPSACRRTATSTRSSALFEAAGEVRRPAARLGRRRVRGLPCRATDRGRHAGRRPRRVGEAVAVLTAHAAAGREWTVVAVPGVQEGSWPDLRLRGSAARRRADGRRAGRAWTRRRRVGDGAAAGRGAAAAAGRRAAGPGERCWSARSAGEDEQPSRFLDELDGDVDRTSRSARPVTAPQRGLVLAELVGELRRVVCDGTGPARAPRAGRVPAGPARRGRRARRAPGLLVRPGRTCPPRIHCGPRSRRSASHRRPSRCWRSARCAGSSSGTAARTRPSWRRSPERWCTRWPRPAAGGADEAQLRAELRRGVGTRSTRARRGSPAANGSGCERMLDTFLTWLRQQPRRSSPRSPSSRRWSSRSPSATAAPWLRVRGRVDRLETDADGRPVVVDIKTGKNPVTKDEAPGTPAARRLPARRRARRRSPTSGWAPNPAVRACSTSRKENKKTGATERTQAPLDEQGVRAWLEAVQHAGGVQRRPRVHGGGEPGLRPLPGPHHAARLHPSAAGRWRQ